MKTISIVIFLFLFCTISNSQNSYINKIINEKLPILNENNSLEYKKLVAIEFLKRFYGNSFKYIEQLRKGFYKFDETDINKKTITLYIYTSNKKNQILAKIEYNLFKNSSNNIDLLIDKGSLDQYIGPVNNSHDIKLSHKTLSDFQITDNMLIDQMILENESLGEEYWRILNKDIINTYFLDQYENQSDLFDNIVAGIIVPCGTQGENSKLVTIDNGYNSILYFDANVMNYIEKNPINQCYGYGGSGYGQFNNPMGISKGRQFTRDGYNYVPIFIADNSNFRIVRIYLKYLDGSDQFSTIENNSFNTLATSIHAYDISYYKDEENESDDKIWVSENNDLNSNITCFTKDGDRVQAYSGYFDSTTNQPYLFESGSLLRLSVYSYDYAGYGILTFIDNVRNTIVTCQLTYDGIGRTETIGGKSYIRAHNLLTFPTNEVVSSIQFQSTSSSTRAWPTMWVTSSNKIHNIKMNCYGHLQYIGSSSCPLNTCPNAYSFSNLKNTITSDDYFDISTIENWSTNYGIRQYRTYMDIYGDTLFNYCEDSTYLMRLKAIFTNECNLQFRAYRLKNNEWDSLKILEFNGTPVESYYVNKFQYAGWNQSSIDLYNDFKLDLPLQDITLGGQIKLVLKMYPEYFQINEINPHFTKNYFVTIDKYCLPKVGGCPFIYTRNEQGDFEADNNILHKMEFSTPSMDITDKYKLRVTPKIVNNSLDLYLVENENDSGFIDQVRLYAVDYPFNKKLGITEDNKIVLYDSSMVLSSDSIMLNNINKTGDLSFHNPSASLTSGYSNDSLYAHFSNLTDKHKRTIYSESSKQSFQTRAVSKNSSKLGPNINYPVAFVTNLRNLEYPVASDKDTAGHLTATSIFSNTVSKMFSRRELESTVILPLFADTDKVDNLKIKWQSNSRMKYLGIANLSYTGYTETEIPMTKGSIITLTNDSDITSVLSSDNSEYGMVNSTGLLKMTYDLSNVPAPGINDVREYVIEVNGYYTKGVNNLVTKPVVNIPQVFYLSQNYPNPFNPITKINYELPRNSNVKIVIYDILGREVTRLVNNELKQAGRYVVEFNAQNYASGVYFYRIEAGDFVQAKKMVLVK